MSEPTQMPDPPRINSSTVQVAETQDLAGADTTFAGTDHMFQAISTMTEETKVADEQRGEREVKQIVATVEEQLTQLALNNEHLVHSASVVFKELRYYDAIRLRPFALNVYQSLLKMIGETAAVPMIVKENLPDFNELAYPIYIDQNALPERLTVSIFHKAPVIEVVIDVTIRSGKDLAFASRFKYQR